jgi:hypothetical protein
MIGVGRLPTDGSVRSLADVFTSMSQPGQPLSLEQKRARRGTASYRTTTNQHRERCLSLVIQPPAPASTGQQPVRQQPLRCCLCVGGVGFGVGVVSRSNFVFVFFLFLG